MRAGRPVVVAAVVAFLVTMSAPPSGAQGESRQRAPSIRVYSQNGAVASRYVTPAIEVSEDAYVFAVSFDLDGQIQILHPDAPGISVRILSHRQLRLPNFFAGFSQSGVGYGAGSGGYVSYADTYVGSENDTRGTVIALASRAPFNLERVESGGDWNISTIRRLIEHRPPTAAAQALAAYLGAKGEPIGFDYMRFASAQYHDYYASTPLYSCDLYYGGAGSGVGFSRLAVLDRVARLRQSGQSVAILGYDFCGMPIVAYGPSQSYTGTRPHIPRDSGDIAHGRDRIPRGRSAQSGQDEPREAAIGTFPVTPGTAMPLGRGALITPQMPNGQAPREILNNPRREGLVRESAERNRPPVERNAPPAQTPVIGTFPVAREYPRPIVREAPVVREPPIARQQPSTPPPPPPRTEPVHSRPASDPVPPPKR
ncbi:MAG: hypothetical protein M3037_14900 [Gemmatimonadota bacterium]|nr:hypothetical protein [Gemmatimonadota bacterium]